MGAFWNCNGRYLERLHIGRCPHPLKSGRGVVLELASGERIFSVSEICRLSCEGEGDEGGKGLTRKGSPEQQARVDYWLDWGCGQLKVCVEFFNEYRSPYFSLFLVCSLQSTPLWWQGNLHTTF